MTVIATYTATDLHFTEDGIVARFDLAEGQGAPTVLQVVDDQFAVALGSSYSLSLEPAAPEAKPVKVPQQVPSPKPSAVPNQTPFLVKTPGMVPQAVPTAAPVAVPGLTPQYNPIPNQVPVASPSINQYVPALEPYLAQTPLAPGQVAYNTPAPMMVQAPNLVPQRVVAPQQVEYAVPAPMQVQVPNLMPPRKDLSDMVRQIMMEEALSQMAADDARRQKEFEEGADV